MPLWASAKKMAWKNNILLRIDDAPSKHSAEVEHLTDIREADIRRLLPVDGYHRADLMCGVSEWSKAVAPVVHDGSVILDITSLPKRVFMFLLKAFLDNAQVRDLVLTYARPAAYPEGLLAEEGLTPAFLPGYAREDDHTSESTLVVGVGYVAFNLEELLEQRHGKVIKFLMPFPPGSPATRRNWRLLKSLHPASNLETVIRRINGLDTFEAYRWICSTGLMTSGSFDMVPLGPKPHAVAMALAHRALGARAQVTYAQPTVYRPDYSEGIAKTATGSLDISAYCLRREGVDLFCQQ